MAPVLGMLFTPLFAVMLAVSAVVYAVTGLGDAFDRDLVSVFDALLVVVLALVCCRMSARGTRQSPAGWWTASSLSPCRRSRPRRDGARRDDRADRRPRVHAEPGGSGRPQPRPPREPDRGRLALHPIPHWTKQAPPARALADTYLPVFALWAAAVVVVLPPLFTFD